MSDDQATADEDRQARVIAKATFMKAAKSTGDIDTMRAAALTIRRTEKSEEKPR